MTSEIVFIGLGGNLEDPSAHVSQAMQALGRLPQSRRIGCSGLYQTKPIGPIGQADYINAVCALTTTLAPLVLLDHLQAIEQAHQRVRTQHWGPRTLDLDLLLFGEQQLHDARLTVPHPRWSERAFVLYPLHEVAEAIAWPRLAEVVAHLAQCRTDDVQRVSEAAG